MQTSPRVLLASRDAATCADLRRRLQEGGCTVVGHAAGPDAVLAAVKESSPDVVIVHIPATSAESLRVARRLRSWHPAVALVAFSSASDGPTVLAAVDAGIRGFVLEDDEGPLLASAVRAVLDGGSPLSPKAAMALVEARTLPGPDRLTARERDVLGLLGDGLTNKDIAVRLGISERTVKAHLTSAFRRLGVQRRTQAAMWVRDHFESQPGTG